MLSQQACLADCTSTLAGSPYSSIFLFYPSNTPFCAQLACSAHVFRQLQIPKAVRVTQPRAGFALSWESAWQQRIFKRVPKAGGRQNKTEASLIISSCRCPSGPGVLLHHSACCSWQIVGSSELSGLPAKFSGVVGPEQNSFRNFRNYQRLSDFSSLRGTAANQLLRAAAETSPRVGAKHAEFTYTSWTVV